MTRSSGQNVTKDPDALLDYATDWSSWLDTGDTIASSLWVVPAGLTITAQSHTTTGATVWLSGGTLGERYEVVNRITTAQGRIEDRSKFITMTQH